MEFLLLSFALLLLILLAGVLSQSLASARDARRFPPPGRLLDVGGHRLHLHSSGEGTPAVVLEAGVAASSLSWQLVQSELARFTRVCSYDRAGLGWSDPARPPRSPQQMVAELHALLINADVPGPYVLVGHSFGGFLAHLYAAQYPREVAGLVLVDCPDPREWSEPTEQQRRMLDRGVLLSRRGAWLARLGVVRFCLALLLVGARWLPRLVARLASGAGVAVTERMVGEVRKLPRELWPVARAFWCQPKSFEAMADYLAALPDVSAQAAAARRPSTSLPSTALGTSRASGGLGDIPLIVLTASNPAPARLAEQQAVACLSTRGRHLVASTSGHWIHLDQPALVVQAIRQVLAAARSPKF